MIKVLTANSKVLAASGKALGIEYVDIDPTRIYAYIDASGYWKGASDSYSIAVPIESGYKYDIELSVYDSTTASTIFRYGQTNSLTPSSSNLLTGWVRSTPQDTHSAIITASKSYLVIQMGATAFGRVLSNGYLTIRKVL